MAGSLVTKVKSFITLTPGLRVCRKFEAGGRNSAKRRHLPVDARRGHDQVQPQVLQRHRGHQLHQQRASSGKP